MGLLAQRIAFSDDDEIRFVYRLSRYPFSEYFDHFFLFSPKPFLCRRLSHFHTAIDWMYTTDYLNANPELPVAMEEKEGAALHKEWLSYLEMFAIKGEHPSN